MLFYLKNAVRFIQRNLNYALVSITGLAISLALVVFLSVYWHTEKNVDTQHHNAENLYRVLRSNECAFSPPFGQYLVDNLPEVSVYCRTFCLDGVLKTDHILIRSEHVFYADSNFFSLFALPLLVGNPQEVLASRNNVVLSESYSKILFPNGSPIGKTLTFNNRLEYTVVGIAKDFGENTHFDAVDVIFPFVAMADFMGGNDHYLLQYDWRWMLPALYVQTNTNHLELTQEKILTDVKTWYWLFSEDASSTFSFQPLTEAYLNPANYGYDKSARTGNANVLKLTVFIILAVCFIAFINFINLSISKANSRLSEIRVKRINGSSLGHFFISFLLEHLLLVLGTLLLFAVLVLLGLPYYNQLLHYNQSLTILLQQTYLLKLIVSFSLTSMLTGIIVMFGVVYSSSISSSLSGNKHRIGFMQKALVVGQYSMSLVLITLMIFIIKQKQFIADYNVGFNKNETLFIRLNREFVGKAAIFKQELQKISGVNSVSLCNGMPGMGILDLRFEQNGVYKNIDWINMDEDYFKTMGIQIGESSFVDDNSCWINESAAKELSFDSDKGMVEIETFGEKRELLVKGILPDMNFHSLYDKAKATVFTNINPENYIDYILLNVNSKQIEHVISQADNAYGEFSTNFPFAYSFVSDKLNQAYEKETRTLKLITWFSVFGILLSSLGMLSLAILLVNNKTKEIGVRKVNGAKVLEIIKLLNSNFVLWVVVSFFIATPISYYIMSKWLENFAYKTTLSWWVFALAGCSALGIAILTVSWQTYRAARRNPIEALRYE